MGLKITMNNGEVFDKTKFELINQFHTSAAVATGGFIPIDKKETKFIKLENISSIELTTNKQVTDDVESVVMVDKLDNF